MTGFSLYCNLWLLDSSTSPGYIYLYMACWALDATLLVCIMNKKSQAQAETVLILKAGLPWLLTFYDFAQLPNRKNRARGGERI